MKKAVYNLKKTIVEKLRGSRQRVKDLEEIEKLNFAETVLYS